MLAPVAVAYAVVVLVWSTTPLAIHFSNESVTFVTAVSIRMLIGATLALILNRALGLPLPIKSVWRSYAAGAIGFVGAMTAVYWAAQFIDSGLIAVVYGTAPLISGVLAWWLLGDKSLTPMRVVMLIVGLFGLAVIFYGQITQGEGLAVEAADDWLDTTKGIGGVLLSCALFSVSAVLVKREQMTGRAPGHPLTQTAGALLFTAPAYLIMWLLFDQSLPLGITWKSVAGIAYLGVFGSVLGFLCYFFILQKLSPDKVALLTLMTPVVALFLGNVVADEAITTTTVLGTGVILFALAAYQWLGANKQKTTGVVAPSAPNMPLKRED